MDKEENFYTNAAIDFLKNRFEIPEPTVNQIEEMKSILFHSWLRRRIKVDERLADREKFCLFLASQGKTYIEIAKTLGISSGTVRNYEKEILRKLFCKNMKQAVSIGIRYGDITSIEEL